MNISEKISAFTEKTKKNAMLKMLKPLIDDFLSDFKAEDVEAYINDFLTTNLPEYDPEKNEFCSALLIIKIKDKPTYNFVTFRTNEKGQMEHSRTVKTFSSEDIYKALLEKIFSVKVDTEKPSQAPMKILGKGL